MTAPQPRPPRARKGMNKALARTVPPKPGLPALLQERTKVHAVAQQLIRGVSLHDIAQEFAVGEDSLRKLIGSAMAELTEQTALLLLNWGTLTLARYEANAQRLFDRMYAADGTPNEGVIRLYNETLDAERRVVELLTRAARASDDRRPMTLQFNPTLLSGSPLYAAGATALQERYRDGMAQREADPALGALDDVLPSGLVPARPPSDPDPAGA